MVDKSTQEVLPNSSKIKDPEGWTTGVTYRAWRYVLSRYCSKPPSSGIREFGK
jgi:hypothetical protein